MNRRDSPLSRERGRYSAFQVPLLELRWEPPAVEGSVDEDEVDVDEEERNEDMFDQWAQGLSNEARCFRDGCELLLPPW